MLKISATVTEWRTMQKLVLCEILAMIGGQPKDHGASGKWAPGPAGVRSFWEADQIISETKVVGFGG